MEGKKMAKTPKTVAVSFADADAVCRFIDALWAMPNGKGITLHMDVNEDLLLPDPTTKAKAEAPDLGGA